MLKLSRLAETRARRTAAILGIALLPTFAYPLNAKEEPVLPATVLVHPALSLSHRPAQDLLLHDPSRSARSQASTAATCAANVQVKGTVVDDTSGAPVSGETVVLQSIVLWSEPLALTTDHTGSFEFQAPRGWYYLYTTGCTEARCGDYMASSYPDRISRKIFEINDPIQNIQLVVSKSLLALSGTVIDGSSSIPIAGATVSAYSTSSSLSVKTDARGAFNMRGVRAGSYTVSATKTPTHLRSSLPGPVDIAPGINGAIYVILPLTPGGRIAGRLTTTTFQPLAKFSIEVLRSTSNQRAGWFDIESTDGSFDIGPIVSGRYTVRAHAPELLSRFHPGVENVVDAAPIDVVSDGVAQIGAMSLQRGGMLSGTLEVKGEQNVCFDKMEVIAHNLETFQTYPAPVASDGKFMIGGLRDGPYRLSFNDSFDERNEYLPGCHGGRRDVSYIDCASIRVTAEAPANGIRYVLERAGPPEGGFIRGRLVDANNGAPLGLAVLWVSKQDPEYFFDNLRASPSGEFMLAALPGCYYLQLLRLGDYIGGYLPGLTPRREKAICVSSGETVTLNVGASRGGSISGRVTDGGTGAPLPGLELTLWTQGRTAVVSPYNYTGSDGRFRIGGVPDGSFTLTIRGIAPYTDAEYAAPIAISGSSSVNGIDFSMRGGASLCGRVVNYHTGAAVGGVWILASAGYDLGSGKSAQSRIDGSFCVSGLVAGSYLVGIWADAQFSSQYYDGTTDRTAATRLEVREGGPVQGIELRLRPRIRRRAIRP